MLGGGVCFLQSIVQSGAAFVCALLMSSSVVLPCGCREHLEQIGETPCDLRSANLILTLRRAGGSESFASSSRSGDRTHKSGPLAEILSDAFKSLLVSANRGCKATCNVGLNPETLQATKEDHHPWFDIANLLLLLRKLLGNFLGFNVLVDLRIEIHRIVERRNGCSADGSGSQRGVG